MTAGIRRFTPTEMVTRVARAMCDEEADAFKLTDPADRKEKWDCEKDTFHFLARAAIRGMLKPTEDMITACGPEGLTAHPHQVRGVYGDVFTVMINAALGDDK